MKNEKSKVTIENNLNKYRQKIEKIPENNIQSVVPEIGVPILEKLMYVSDEILVELYTELLAKASDKEKCDSTHPSFVNIINNLSPKEIRILEFIYEKSLAIVSVNVITDDSSHPVEQISELALEVDIYDENTTAHISNLVGLGLIDMNFNIQFSNIQRYVRLEDRIKQIYSNAPIELQEVEMISHLMRGNVSFGRGTIKISSFGGLFLKACTENRRKTELFNLFSSIDIQS